MSKTIFEQFSEMLDANPALVLQDGDLEPPDYLSGLDRSLVEVAQAFPAPTTSASVADERIRVRGEFEAYAAQPDPDHMLLVTAPAGFGKTFAGVDFVHDLLPTIAPARVIYYGVRHAFYPDVLEAAAQLGNNPADWIEWLPRQAGSAVKVETCRLASAIKEWQTKGFKSMDFCLGVCKPDYVNNECPYHLQKKSKERVVFGQHAHAVLGHPLDKEFGLAIGDENPMLAFYKDWLIPRRALTWDTLDPQYDIAAILDEMKTVCDDDKTLLFGPELIKRFGGPDRIIAACDAYPLANIAANMIKPQDEDEAAEAPYNFLLDFIPLLRREALRVRDGLDYLHRIYLTCRGLTLVLRNYASPEMPKHLIWFDGTGRQDIYEILFRRPVKVVTCNPPMAGTIIQVVDRSNCKTSMVRKGETTNKVDQAKAMVERIRQLHGGCDVVTYKTLVDQGEFPDALWFYANRGTNVLNRSMALAVLGTPQTPLNEIERLAKSLLFERDDPFDTRWITELVAYRHVDDEGKSWARPISTFADEVLRIFLYQLREAEIIQSAHRARPLTRAVPVYLLTNLAIDELAPTKLMTINELMDAPPDVNVFTWADVMAQIEQICAEKGYVTASDLEEVAAVSKPTALKYFEMLSKQGEWELALTKPPKGKPTKALVQKESSNAGTQSPGDV